MSLTGIPLIVLAFAATAGVGALTVLGWSRSGRGRYAGRVGGVLLSEALLVFAAGLVVNRAQDFYPSWTALAGRVGTTAAAPDRVAGRLDQQLAAGAVAWRPARTASWHLAGGATISVPSGYETSAGLSYPVVLELRPRDRDGHGPGGHGPGGHGPDGHGPDSGGRAAPGAVTVTLPVTPRTTAAALASLPGRLASDARVGAGGWAVVAPAAPDWAASLAGQLAWRDPERYVAVALVGPARVRTAGSGGAAPRRSPAPPGPGPWAVRVLPDWAAAVDWAAEQTAAPLAAPVELPPAVRG